MKIFNSEYVTKVVETLTEATAGGKAVTRAQLAEKLGLEERAGIALVDLLTAEGELSGFTSRRGPSGGLLPVSAVSAAKPKNPRKVAEQIVDTEETVSEEEADEAVAV